MALTAHPALRWAVPGAVVAIVLGAAAITSVAATAPPTLPARSAAELLVDVQGATVPGFSGTIVQKAELGLPELPVQIGGQGSASFGSLVSGTHTLRIWYGGEDRQRLALLGTLGESDLVRNGPDLWTWSSDSNAATHYTLPQRPPGAPATEQPDVPAMTPQEAADAALAALDPTTAVTTEGTDSVAGRSAYELVLAPKDSGSLIGQVRIAIDAEYHLPLRVQVLAAQASTPAFEVGFSAISFEMPGADQFTFTPPPDATVTESTLGQGLLSGVQDFQRLVPVEPTAAPEIVGGGWTSVLVVSMPAAASGGLGSILGSLPVVTGPWGSGRLLQSALVSVLLTDDGRVIAGAVTPELLYQAAAR